MARGVCCEPAWHLSLRSLHCPYTVTGPIELEELIHPYEIESPLPVHCRLIGEKLAGEQGDVLLGQLLSRGIVFHQIAEVGLQRIRHTIEDIQVPLVVRL